MGLEVFSLTALVTSPSVIGCVLNLSKTEGDPSFVLDLECLKVGFTAAKKQQKTIALNL